MRNAWSLEMLHRLRDWHVVEPRSSVEPMDGKSSSMIEADAKRRCVAASSAIALPSRVGNQA